MRTSNLIRVLKSYVGFFIGPPKLVINVLQSQVTLQIKATTGKKFQISWGDGRRVTVNPNGLLQNYNSNYADTTKNYTITIRGSLADILEFKINNNLAAQMNIAYISYCTNIQVFSLWNTISYGDVKYLANCKKLKTIELGNTLVAGELTVFNGLPVIEILSLSNTKIVGNIAFLSSSTLKRLYIRDTFVQGNLDYFTQCPILEILDVSGSTERYKVTGTFANFASMPLLADLYITYCVELFGNVENFVHTPNLKYVSAALVPLVGNISQLFKLPNIYFTQITQATLSYEDTELPMLSGYANIALLYVGFFPEQLDALLIDLDNSGTMGPRRLQIWGVVRTPLSDTAYNNLIAKGWELAGF